ncbi:hypothetical protein Scep_009342 [Stephania cephalantha]|uniref:Uncharacterized protein n=1 Tax=Stephania cephalantha TaxID=152367 RepID=A0AAP0PG65_9MAGN
MPQTLKTLRSRKGKRTKSKKKMRGEGHWRHQLSPEQVVSARQCPDGDRSGGALVTTPSPI